MARRYTEECEDRLGGRIPWVFHENGRQIDGNSKGFYKTWREACQRAGVLGRDGRPKMPHDGRRTAVRASEWSGVPRNVAKALVGHKTDSMYDRYHIVRGDDLEAGVQKLGRFTARTASGEPAHRQ